MKTILLLTGCLYLAFTNVVTAQTVGRQRVISVDLNDVKGPLPQSSNLCVGAGRANEGLRADWQRQLKMVHDECGFRYIRFHGLLSDDMGVYFEDKGKPVYNWQYIDELFDFLLRIKMKPFVEVGFMPGWLASGSNTIFWWRGNVTPPNNYQKWDDLIKAMVKHWVQRYGEDEVANWYFEIWNEPNLKGGFFTGDQQDYFKLYRETAIAIKSVSKKFRVGGPATAGNAWVPEMINFCQQNSAPIDFISTHDYGVKQGFLDANGQGGTVIDRDRNVISNHMKGTRQTIRSSALSNLELHYTEWSASYSPADPIHDSYHEAAYILNTVKQAAPYINSMSYWTFTDIFEEAGPRSTPFHGGFGLVNYEDLKKPAYYAFKYLNQLGKTELKTADSSAIICKDKNGVQALLWNFTIDHPGDSVHNDVFYKRNLPSKELPPVNFKIKGLKPGKYTVDIYKTGYGVNDIYTAYYKMGSPSQLTREQVGELKKQNSEKPISTRVVVVNNTGRLEENISLRQNDVIFMKISRII
ncbi:GH39 family glycosyl hydrolase [Mucilaginibacter ginsenosidivorans]|uniref:Glycoside hydrolase n=1 Tax=Mucilaginibacter ginsenosidivorans TaxID=398053 RepID=A0A5B8URV0_9SPHI|nr:glycoside hydrolase [Mucilaginibacter ginsenosidivorans]QEC61578.1 glycoside hydrolase [Mucilaginibacter ginsenosidivorans]